MIEMDKFLKGEPNTFKEHKNFVNYQYQYLDKGFPTVEQAHEVFHQQSAIQNKI